MGGTLQILVTIVALEAYAQTITLEILFYVFVVALKTSILQDMGQILSTRHLDFQKIYAYKA